MTESVDSLWAREGDVARDAWAIGSWSPFASPRGETERATARILLHGFDFHVESDHGTKRLVKTGGGQ